MAVKKTGRDREQDLVKVANARYYIWQTSDGWHVRTAAKGLTRFTGSLQLKHATFGKLRPIGLEKKGRYPDH